ncbi:MAG: hypothetical protein IJB81_12275 [Clostridia bacterium]|nr:hypothetical protein [Clostridia bacterium]
MKKLLTMLLALLLALCVLPAMAETTMEKDTLPEEIADLFDAPAWAGYQVPYTSKRPEMLAYIWLEYFDCGLVLQSNGQLKALCLIERSSKGEMRITARNFRAVRGESVPIFDSTPVNGTNNVVLEMYGEDYMLAFSKVNGQWRVVHLYDYRNGYEAVVTSEKIGIAKALREEWQENDVFATGDMEYAYGTFDNRFAAFTWDAFPKTIREAREKLTNPPVTPTDFFAPATVQLRAGEQYDVFAAPGRDSHRAAGGRAVMSTNDWVQIFGEENGWLLVQYDISRDHMRFGYIDASALKRGDEVQTLRWYDLPEQTVKTAVSVTDDPLVSCATLCWLSAGERVRVLSSFGDWYYIETTDDAGRLLRGFVPGSCIDLLTEEDMVG